MAIAKLKKIQILGHNSQHDEALSFLQQEGQVEVIDLKDKSEDYKDFPFQHRTLRYEEITETVEKLSWLVSFFETLSETKRSPLAAKPVLRRKELLELLGSFDYDGLHSHCRRNESSLKDIERKDMELDSRNKELQPWLALDVPLDAIGETDLTASLLATLAKKNFPSLVEEVEAFPDTHVEVVDGDEIIVRIFVAYLKSAEEEVAELLRKHEVTVHHLPRHHGLVREVLKDIAAEKERLQSRRASLLDEAKALLPEESKVAALSDYFSNLETKESTKSRLLYSQETFFLQGWIRQEDAHPAQRKLQKRFDTVEVYLSDPSPDDALPILLENKELIRPFEFLTRIYGYPAYGDIDPTPVLAPFFFLFFGYCLGDAVYGLILVSASIFALKKFRMGWQGTRFFRLLLYCGLSTIVVGALTGGWLGNLLGIRAILLDPQKEPTPVLNLALVLGIVQIWTGYAVAAYANLRRRQYKAALLDQGPIFPAIAGLTGIGLVFLKTLSAEALKPSVIMVSVGAVVILAAHGRNQRSPVGKFFLGLLSLYSVVSGYLSDILSYSRLWALGLVTGAMASTVNLFASTIAKTTPVVGVVFAVLFLAVGHVFTLLINVLGAFVHSMRLQFVEFFSKFFASTGKPFRPLSIENRFTVVGE